LPQLFVDAAATDLLAAAAAEVLAMGVGVAAAEEDDDAVAVDMPFNGSMGSIEYLIATSLMPHGGGSTASTEALIQKRTLRSCYNLYFSH